MPLSVNFTKLMYVSLTFSVPEVSFDLDSFRFEVPACGSSAKDQAAPKKQSAKINPIVFVFIRRSNLDLHFPSTFLCSALAFGALVAPLFRAQFAHVFFAFKKFKSCVPSLNPPSTSSL